MGLFSTATFSQGYESEESSLGLKIEACRVALKDMEKFRSKAIKLGNLDFFDSLFLNAEQVLFDIDDRRRSPAEVNYLLGQCQGILDSLALALNSEKYGRKKRATSYGAPPETVRTKMNRNQAVSRPNRVIHEPLDALHDDEDHEKNVRVIPHKATVKKKHVQNDEILEP